MSNNQKLTAFAKKWPSLWHRIFSHIQRILKADFCRKLVEISDSAGILAALRWPTYSSLIAPFFSSIEAGLLIQPAINLTKAELKRTAQLALRHLVYGTLLRPLRHLCRRVDSALREGIARPASNLSRGPLATNQLPLRQ